MYMYIVDIASDIFGSDCLRFFFFSANPDIRRHIRALFVCAALLVTTVVGLTCLWSSYFMSTWLLAVTGFSVEVISKVLISLALYGLFLADAKLSEFWSQLDDHVYRVRLVE